MTANDAYPQSGRYAELKRREKEIRITVLNVSASASDRCGDCGADGLLFHCHCYQEPDRPIRDLCRSCAITRAGAEERIWLRDDRPGLREVWRENRRRRATGIAAIKAANSAKMRGLDGGRGR